MPRPLVRSTRLIFPLCMAFGLAVAVAFVRPPTKKSLASIPAAPGTVLPGMPGARALSYLQEQRSDNSRRKPPANTTSRPAENQRPGDSAPTTPLTEEEREKEAEEGEEEEDPDLPGFVKINKADFLRQRAEYIGAKRGFGQDPLHTRRAEALQQMEQHLRSKGEFRDDFMSSVLLSNSVWRSVGPAPIPNGQTTGRTDPVSGRAISIAVHPTNPDIVYVGTSQGGLYRSLDGGAHWTPLMDTAQSLSIGALALAPSNPSILYVGTGENGIAADSFFGVGLYRIENADTNATLFGPINPPVQTGIAGTTAFTGRAVSEILVHPTDPATIFVATAGGTSSNPSNLGFTTTPPLALRGVYRSTNATSASPAFTKLTVTSANSVAPDETGDRDIMDIVMEPGNPNVILAWVGGTSPFAPPADTVTGVYRTTDALGAATFTQTFTSTLAGARGEFAINKIGNTVNVVVATGETGSNTLCNTGDGAVRTSNDGGVTWSAKRPGGGGFCGGQCFFDIAVELHPTNANIILLGGSVSGICSLDFGKSTDGAATNFVRNNAGLHADTHALAIAPSNHNIVYIGSDGGIWKSVDMAQTWTSLNGSGFNATQFQDMALHPLDREFMFGGTQDNGTLFKQPDGVWRRADFGDGGHALIDQSATDTANVTIYHTYANLSGNLIGFARITNTGCANESQWSFRGSVIAATDETPACPLTPSEPAIAANGIRLGDSVRFYPPMALGPGTPNVVYFGTDKLYRDGATRGDQMEIVSQDLGGANNTITSIAISRENDNVRIIGTFDGKVFATTTGATTMTDVTDTAEFPGLIFGVRRAVTDIAIDPNNPNVAYIAFAGYEVPSGRHIFKTTDLQATLANPALWTPAGNGIPDVPVDSLAIDPANSNILYAGTDIGVYITTDAGANWTPFSAGLPRVAVFDLEIQAAHRVLRAVTHGRGMWEIALIGDLPGISDIPDQVTNLNTPDTTPFAVGSATASPDGLILSATIANPSLASVSFSGTGNDRMMLITPAANQAGTTEITVTVTEGFKSNSDSFFLTINPTSGTPPPPSNQAPVLDNTGNMSLSSINEDATDASNSGTTVSAIIASAGGDRITDADAGALEGIAVIGVNNTSGTWQFTINNGAAWTPFGSPNVAAARLLGVASTTRIRFVPNANFNGTVSPGITFRAWDQTSGTNGNTADTTSAGGATAFSTATETASITVNALNDAPSFTKGADQAVSEDAGAQTVLSWATNIGPGPPDEAGQTLAFIVTGNTNSALFSVQPTVSSTGTLVYTPAADASGEANITLTLSDGTATSAPQSFKITVNAVNDAPVNTVPGAQSVIENGTLSLSTANSNRISISDIDAGANLVAVTLVAANGTLTLHGTSGLTFTPAGANNDGAADTTLSFQGAVASVNAALDGLQFKPNQGYDGPASVQIQTSDQGFTGSGGVKTDSDTFNITVLDGGVLAFQAATYTADEGAGTATITVSRTGSANGEARVDYSTGDGTALAGADKDYLSATGQLIFPEGVATKSFTVQINNDALDEAPETINLTLSNVTGSGTLGSQKTATLTITDDDGAPSLSVNDVSLSEGSSGTTAFNFTVTLSAVSGQAVTVNYVTANGTAAAPSDYQAIASTQLTFAPGEITKTINVLVNGDTGDEPDETFFVNLSGAVNAAVADGQGSGTILNDDEPGVKFSASSYSISEAEENSPQRFSSMNLEVIRTGDTSQAATVRYFTSDLSGGNECNAINGHANQRCDYLLVGATLRFAAGDLTKTISIPVVDDGYVEGPEVFTIQLQNPSGTGLDSPAQATLTILDDDIVPSNGNNNPYLSNAFFVRMHYLDFLGRDADQQGFTGWTNVLNACGTQQGFLGAPFECDRAHVSHGFYASPEFTDTGFRIYRLYEVGMNRLPRYVEFISDMATLSGFGIEPSVEQQNLKDYLQQFSAKTEFTNRFQNALLPSQAADLVLKMEQTAGITLPESVQQRPDQPTQYTRTQLINLRATGALTVGETLKAFVEQQAVYDKYFPRGAVTMQYFANLRRDPDLNDPNLEGWTEWVFVFTNGGALRGRPDIGPRDIHHLIFGFIYSEEYRKRFGAP